MSNLTGIKNNSGYSSQYLREVCLERGQEHPVRVLLDFPNKRLKLLSYANRNMAGLDMAGLDNFLLQTARKYQMEKVLVTANQRDWEKYLTQGYVLECMNKFYFNGKPAYHLAKFLSITRQQSSTLQEENSILKMALEKSIKQPVPLMEGFTVRPAREQDIPAMVKLFTRVFSTYPAPVDDPDYLRKSMYDNSYYLLVINNRGDIVSTISAEINHNYHNAEVTDCSTLPKYRSMGLMSAMLANLEMKMKEKDIINLYSIARAISPGINIIFRQNAYTYGGRFINNCNISGGFEDMNLWFKQL